MAVITNFLNFLVPYGLYSYFVMFGVLLACGFGFPMPEDVILITGGILSARGVCAFHITTLVCMSGVLVGDGIIFFLGRYFGPRIKRSWLFSRIMTERVDAKIQKVFSKYGDKVVFMGRFMPGLRMPIFLTAGIYQISPVKFFTLDGAAAVISVPVWIWVGFFFGENFEILEMKIRQFQFGLYSALIVIVLSIVTMYVLKRYFLRRV